MATIEEMAENMYYTTLAEKAAYWDGANAVLEKVESLIGNTSGEGEVYHYNLYLGLQKLVKELKG